MTDQRHWCAAIGAGSATTVVKRALRLLAAVLAGVAAALPLLAPQSAAAISGLQRVSSYSGYDDRPWKAATAGCPANKHVIGGGAWVSDGGRKLVRLTTLRPQYLDGAHDAYIVQAEAPGLRRDFSWSVTVYAVCADENALKDYRIVPGSPGLSSARFQTAAAVCPTGTLAYGTGAGITTPIPNAAPARGQIGLQLTRTSGPLDISRAAARSSGIGYVGPWQLTSYVICAQPRGTIHVEGAGATGDEVTDSCKTGFTHGPGGGAGLFDNGPAWLQKIYPSYDGKSVAVAMTAPPVGGIIAHQTCAL